MSKLKWLSFCGNVKYMFELREKSDILESFFFLEYIFCIFFDMVCIVVIHKTGDVKFANS